MFDFPANPIQDQEYAPPGGPTYVYQDPAWVVKGGTASGIGEAPTDGQQYGRQSLGWTPIVPNPDWSSLGGKPTTFPPSAHTHPQSEVTGLVSDLALKAPLASPTFTGTVTMGPLNGTTAAFSGSVSIGGNASFGSVVAASTVDLSKHIALYGTSYGFNVTSASLNVVAGGANSATFSSTGLNVKGALTVDGVATLDGGIVSGGSITAITSLYVKPPSSAVTNIHLWFRSFTDVERTVIYTTAASQGDLIVRVGGSDYNYFRTGGGFETVGNLVASGTIYGAAMVLTNEVDSASTAPAIYLDRLSATPAISDGLGIILFRGNSSTKVVRNYAYIYARAEAVANGAESGALIFNTMNAGAATTTAIFDSASTALYGTLSVAGAATISGQLNVTGHVVSDGYFIGSATAAILGNLSGAGTVYLRPNGYGSGTGQAYLNSAGDFYVTAGNGTFVGSVTSSQSFISSSTNVILATTGVGVVYLRPAGSGSTSNQAYVNTDGSLTVSGNVTASGSTVYGAALHSTGYVYAVSGYSSTGASAGWTTNVWLRGSAASGASTAIAGWYNINGNVGNIVIINGGTTYTTSSDEMLKNVVGEYDQLRAIEIIRADPVMDWYWKADGTPDMGWVAQKSYSVDPGLAVPPAPNEEDFNNRLSRDIEPGPGEPGFVPWGIDYGRRTPYLWAALTWALDQIDDLKARLTLIEGQPA